MTDRPLPPDRLGDDDYTAADERMASVAFLRAKAASCQYGAWGIDREALLDAAARIERGEHTRAEGSEE